MKEMDELEVKPNPPAPVEVTGNEREGKKKREHLLVRIIRVFLKSILRKRSVDDVTDEEITRELTKRKLAGRDKNDSNSPIDLFFKAREIADALEKKAGAAGGKKASKEEFDNKLDQLVQEGFVKDGKIWASKETLKRVIALQLVENPTSAPKDSEEEERMMKRVDQMAQEALKEGLPLSYAEIFVKYRAIQQFVEVAKARGTVDQKTINAIIASPELKRKVSDGFTSEDRYFGSKNQVEQVLAKTLGRKPTEAEVAQTLLLGTPVEENAHFLFRAPGEDIDTRSSEEDLLHDHVGELSADEEQLLQRWEDQARLQKRTLGIAEQIDIIKQTRALKSYGQRYDPDEVVSGSGEDKVVDFRASIPPIDRDHVKDELENLLGRAPTQEELDKRVGWFETRDRLARTYGYQTFESSPFEVQSQITTEMNGVPLRSMVGGAGAPPEAPPAPPAGPTGPEQPPQPPVPPGGGGGGNGIDPSERQIRREQINDIDDLVERMADVDPQWQWENGSRTALVPWKKGRFPLKTIDRETGRLEINQANFMRWVRERMLNAHNDNSDDPGLSFWTAIQVSKGYSQVNINEIATKYKKYLRSDATGKLYEELAQELKREVWLFNKSREWEIQYRKVMGLEDELPKAVANLFYDSIFTKTAWGGSTLFHILTLPKEFDSKPVERDKPYDTSEKKVVTDVGIGSAARTGLLAYYYLSDFDKLQEILGSDASIFKRDALRVSLKKLNRSSDVIREQPNSVHGLTEDGKDDGTNNGLTPEDIKTLSKIFDAQGRIKDKKAYREYINIFFDQEKEKKTVDLVRGLIRDSVGERYGLKVPAVDEKGNTIMKKDAQGNLTDEPEMTDDDLSTEYAETFAYTMARWMGIGARNDNNARAFDALSKVLNTAEYRLKQFDPGRGGAFGNPYTVKNIKQLAADFLVGVRTETVDYDKTKKGLVATHYKSPLQILEEADRNARLGSYNKTSDTDLAPVQQEMAKMHELLFPENTMRSYAVNHLNNTYKIFGNLMSGEELRVDKYIHFDVYGRTVFEEAQFSEAVKEKFLKPMRYSYDTYSQLDFTQHVRDWNPDYKENGVKIGRWEDKSLVEAMFGREILDIPKFWKRDYKRNTDGSIVKDANGKPIVLGIQKHVVDPELIQANKDALWKQLALTRLAGELYAHRNKKGRYAYEYFETFEKIYAGLESIPADLTGDDTDMTKLKVEGHFFSKEDIKWLRKKSKTEYWRLDLEDISMSLASGGFKGMKEAFEELMKYVTK